MPPGNVSWAAIIRGGVPGNADSVKKEVESGVSPLAVSKFGKTLLHAAAAAANAEVAKFALENGVNINAVAYLSRLKRPEKRTQGWTALMYAIRSGSESMVRWLLEKGALPIESRLEETPFELALSFRAEDIFWILVEYGYAEFGGNHRPPMDYSLMPPEAPIPSYSRREPRYRPSRLSEITIQQCLNLVPPEEVSQRIARVGFPVVLCERLQALIFDAVVPNYSRHLLDANAPEHCDTCGKGMMSPDETEKGAFLERCNRLAMWGAFPGYASYGFLPRCTVCRMSLVSIPPELLQPQETENRAILAWDLPGYAVARKTNREEDLLVLLAHQSLERVLRSGEETALQVVTKSQLLLPAYWLTRCLKNHLLCRLDDERPILPRRVIEISRHISAAGARTFTLKVAENKGHERGQYCTLSYRWSSTPLTLTTSNLAILTRAINFQDLPVTIQHSITIAEALGFDYIWIDALCIIQDSVEDWKDQSAVMHDIYTRSTVTLSASDGKEPTGIVIPKEPTNSSENRFVTPGGDLDRRGWCLQEQALSRRVLSFSEKGVFWSCLRWECSDGFPASFNFDRKAASSTSGVMPWLLSGPSAGSPEENASAGYGLWHRLLADYTARDLTHESDRSVALRGITSAFSRQLQDTSHAGVWEKNIVDDLAWYRGGPPNYRTRFKCPSWSCLSVGSRVELMKLDHVTFGYERWVRSISVSSRENTDGSISGELVVCAPTIPVRLSGPRLWFSLLEGRYYDPGDEMQRHLEYLSRNGVPWTCDGKWKGERVTKMAMFGFYGLCLAPGANNKPTRRIGICHLNHDLWKTISAIMDKPGWEDTWATVTII